MFNKSNEGGGGCSTRVLEGVPWHSKHGRKQHSRLYPLSCLEGLIQKNQNLTNTITSHSINNSKLFHLHF